MSNVDLVHDIFGRDLAFSDGCHCREVLRLSKGACHVMHTLLVLFSGLNKSILERLNFGQDAEWPVSG